jgi:hypothetical protein
MVTEKPTVDRERSIREEALCDASKLTNAELQAAVDLMLGSINSGKLSDVELGLEKVRASVFSEIWLRRNS